MVFAHEFLTIFNYWKTDTIFNSTINNLLILIVLLVTPRGPFRDVCHALVELGQVDRHAAGP